MGARAHSRSNGRGAVRDPWAVPVLEARRDGPAERFAARLRGRHPAVVFFAAGWSGFALLALVSIALGLLVTEVLLQTGGLASSDQSAVESIVA